MTAAVRLVDLHKVYPGPRPVTAVDGISLEVAAGTIYGLLGPNGAGKTTTIGICTTRVRATRGEVTVAGCDVRTDAIRLRARIGVASQAVTLDRSCTIGENLYYHCRYFGMARRPAQERAREVMERFQIADRRDAMPGQLSGGLAQRAQLARAIAHRPQVLFLDEPTAGLDPQSRLVLWDLVRALRTEGITVVVTTHYMEEAEQLCDQLAIVDHGRVLVSGAPQALKQAAGGATVVDATLAGPTDAARDALTGMSGVREVVVTERGLRVLTEVSGVPRIVALLAQHHVTDLRVTEPSLETVFIGLTGRELRE